MEAIVTYDGLIDVKKEDGTISTLKLKDRRVKIISKEGDNIYWCEPLDFPWKGKFSIRKSYLQLIKG